MPFVFQNGKWTKDGKVVTPAEVKAATKRAPTPGYSGSFLPQPSERAGEVCEDCSGTPHMSGSVDDVPLWHPGERQVYDKIRMPSGLSMAEEIEIEDDMKHAFDY